MAKRERIKIEHTDYIEYMIMLLAPMVVAWYYHGADAIRLIGTGIVSAVVFDAIGLLVTRRKLNNLMDMSAAFTGAAIAMLMPASANSLLVVAGTAFAIIAVKIPFGSAFKTPFVPAAAAVAFITVCFPTEIYNFPVTEVSQVGSQSSISLAAMVNAGGSYHLDSLRIMSILSGSVAGPIGTTCAAALIGVCVFFLVFKPKKLLNVAGFVLACAIFAVLFPRGSFGRITSLITELCAGSLLFGAVFFATDSATSPEHGLLRFLYGGLGGAICMMLRHFGAFEDPTCFAILLANAFWPMAVSLLRRLHLLPFFEKNNIKGKTDKLKKLKKVKKEKKANGGEA